MCVCVCVCVFILTVSSPYLFVVSDDRVCDDHPIT